MSSNHLKTIIYNLKEQGEMSFLPPVTSKKIKKFEKECNIKLPKEYKEWLMFSDGGELFLPAGIQLYGIESKPRIYVEKIDILSHEYTIIGALSTGDPIMCENNKDYIAIYNQAMGVIEEDEVYRDFFSFLSELPEILGVGE